MIDLRSNQLAQVKQVLETFVPHTTVWAFGSRVRMTAGEHSDLDLVIVIVADQKTPQEIFYQLKDAFEESDLPIKVDVLDWHRISPEFQKNIEKQYEVIFP